MDAGCQPTTDPRRTLALVLAGGAARACAIHQRARQARGCRRQVPHHRLRAVELHELGPARIGVITQYKSHSLLRHLQRGWSFLRNEMGEFVDCCPPSSASTRNTGTRAPPTRCSRTSTSSSRSTRPTTSSCSPATIVQDGLLDHAFDHVASGGCHRGLHRGAAREPSAFGVMAIDDRRHITAFVEKPADPPPMPGNPGAVARQHGHLRVLADYLFHLLGTTRRIRTPATTSART